VSRRGLGAFCAEVYISAALFLVIERVPVLSGVGRKKGRVPKEDKIGRT